VTVYCLHFHNRKLQMKTAQPLPLPVARSLKRLGANISKARRRREVDQATFATFMGVSLASLKRLEAGKPGVGLHMLVRALLALQRLDDFDQLLEAPNDKIGLIHQDDNLPKRVRKSA
jgi:transcriptional regulator with XRE-family HTH domain